MSAVRDILERLSGVHVVAAKLDITMDRLEKLSDWLLDHERRLVTLEAEGASRSGAVRARSKELPRKK
jgi:hypothetical protein